MVNRIAMFKALISPETAPDDLIQALLDRADAQICNITNRQEVPEALTSCSVDMAIVMFNRRGTEGESQRTEGVLSRTFLDDYPTDIRDQLYAYRKVRVYRETD